MEGQCAMHPPERAASPKMQPKSNQNFCEFEAPAVPAPLLLHMRLIKVEHAHLVLALQPSQAGAPMSAQTRVRKKH